MEEGGWGVHGRREERVTLHECDVIVMLSEERVVGGGSAGRDVTAQ